MPGSQNVCDKDLAKDGFYPIMLLLILVLEIFIWKDWSVAHNLCSFLLLISATNSNGSVKGGYNNLRN